MSIFTHSWVSEAELPIVCAAWRKKSVDEQVGNRFTLTEAGLKDALFRYKNAEMRLTYANNQLAAFCMFALTVRNFEFFEKPGLFIHCFGMIEVQDSSQVYPALMADLKKIAVERGCGRIDWVTLKTNEAGLAFSRTASDIHEVDYLHTFRITI